MKTRTTTRRRHGCVRLASLPSIGTLTVLIAAAGAAAAPVLEGRNVRSGRVEFTIDGTGLPGAISLPPRQDELPLAQRGGGGVPADVLAGIGRGPLLRGPARIEAIINGKPVVAEAKQAATPAASDAEVRAQATLAAGAVSIAATTSYRDTGGFEIELKVAANEAGSGLKLVLPLTGVVDLAIPLAAAAAVPDPPLGAFTPAAIDGIVWSTAKGNGSAAVVPAPGLASPVFFGSGDRGFVVTAIDAAGWPLDPAGSSCELVRDKAGAFEAHVWLANQPTGLAAARSFKLAFQVLPASPAEPLPRASAWQKPAAGGTPAAASLKAPTVTGVIDLPAATVLLPDGRIGSSELFRYLSGGPAGLPGVIRADPKDRQLAGRSPSNSRALIGRALLHGLVVDSAAVAHRADLFRAVRALAASGLFEAASAVEFVPPWRSAGLARYGEEFKPEGGFEVTAANPVARVHTAAFVMSRGTKPDAPRQTLFVVMNEGDKPVREQFYVTGPRAAFGGGNRTSSKQIVGSYDYTGLPPESDWRKEILVGVAPGTTQGLEPALYDIEDGGYVVQTSASDALEVYGPLFIPARSYRLLWASGEPGALPVLSGGN